jgi:NAD(P) transhydrogenase subunit alpha
VQVSAAPAVAAALPAAVAKPARTPLSAAARVSAVLAGIAVFWLVITYAPAPVPQDFTVLTLAIVIGYYVIGKVHHALHTPLMSVTNAISGVIVVGALVQVGLNVPLIQVLAGIAIGLAAINIFGGFAVTRRMLSMFSKGK